MIRFATKEDEDRILGYLKDEAVYHTFLIADILNYGFDKEFQTVYLCEEGEEICGVYLRFYGNLIVAGETKALEEEFFQGLFGAWEPEMVMGKEDLVTWLKRLLPDYSFSRKELYLLEDGQKLVPEDEARFVRVRKGIPGDEEKIHEFLMGIPEIRALYTSREMIADRLKSGDGTHLYLEDDRKAVIAHANSAAQSPYTVMIGGVAVRREERGNRLSALLISRLCREILASGKKPCCFCDSGEAHNIFMDLGFHRAGMWATLTKPVRKKTVEGKLPSYLPVYNQLYQDLMDGVYEKGSLLPGENALAAAYKVSRNTLRQALTILSQDGYIYKQQGKGTYVSYDRHKKEQRNLCNFLRECAKEPVRRVTMDYNVGPPTNIARAKLEVEEGERILASNNVYWGDDGPIGQSFLQIPLRVLSAAGIDFPQPDEERLLDYMDAFVYQNAVRADCSFLVMTADEQVIPYMDISEETVLLHIEEVLYGQDGRPAARIKYFFIPNKYQVSCQLQA